ncbi:MAG: insulinase family protein [Bacteroidota bacterium]
MKIKNYHWLSLLAIGIFIVACTSTTPVVQDKTMPNPAVVDNPTEDMPEPASIQSPTIPVDDRVRMGQLDNGLKYFIQKNGKPENRAELRLAVNAGSMQEDDDQLGLAHFVEHMAFNGSKNFKKNELVDYLESIGTRFGADLNAYTTFDETVYMLEVRTDDEEKMMKGLLVLEDWAGGLNFDHEEIDKERGVVVSEWRSRLSPDQRMQQEYFPIMYKDSRYATRLPIGDPEIIKNADYEVVKRFYNDWYRPDLMAVVVVGDIDVDQIEQEIKTRFGKLTNPKVTRAKEKYKVPGHKETLVSINSDKEASFTRVQLMYKHEGEKTKTEVDFRRQMTHSLYNSMLNSRLDELTQSPEPPFTFSYTGYGGDVGSLATYSSYAFTKEGGALQGLESVLEETERVVRHGFNQSELDRTKLEMIKGIERAVKEMDKVESRRLVGKYVYHFLKGNPIPNETQQEILYKKYLPTITLEEVNALADKWVTDENRVVVITGPQKEESPLPTEAEVLAVFDKVSAKELAPYEDKVSDDPLLATELTPVKIAVEKMIDEVEVIEYTLDNGVRVVLKPTDFKNDEIMMRAYSPGGTSLYSDADYPSAANASRIINEGGISTFDLPQLQKKLAGKKVNVSPSIGSLYEYMNGGASPDDLETLLQLTYLYFTAPRADKDVVTSYINKQKSIYKNLFSNPQYWFMNETSKIKYGENMRMSFPTEAMLDQITLEKVMEVYKDRFADASDFTFFFVGNFEVENMKALTAKYLGNLPNIGRKESWKDLGIRVKDGQIRKDLVRGAAPKALIDMTYHGEYTKGWTPKELAKFYMASELLRIKMRESMREDKGGVYGVGVRSYVSQKPTSTYTINISFNSEPDKVEELIKTGLNDIETIKKEGVQESDLNKVKETRIQGRTKDLKENRWWMGQMMSTYQEDWKTFKYADLENYKTLVESITPADIQQTVKDHFNEENFIRIVMMPEAAQSN